MSDGAYDDDGLGPPVCERCGEPCHWCEPDFPDDPDPGEGD